MEPENDGLEDDFPYSGVFSVVNPNPEDIGQCDDGLPEREGNETEGVVEELLLIDGTLATPMAAGYSINKI